MPIVVASKIVDHHFGWPKDFVATAITALKGFEYHLIGLRWIVAHADRFVIQRVERPAQALFGFDAMETQ